MTTELNIKRTDYEKEMYKEWNNSDSMYERLRLASRYLSSRIRNMERIIAQDFPDNITEIELEEIISDLVDDLSMARIQLGMDYPAVAEYVKY